MSPHNTSREELLKALGTDAGSGLTGEQLAALTETYGKNRLSEKKKKTMLQRFLDQFKDVMIIILIIAAVISFIIAVSEGNPKEFFEQKQAVLPISV